MVWEVLIGITAGIVVIWLALIAAPWLAKGRFDLGALRGGLRLLPDFIPVIGYADDAIIIAIALRSVIRRSGPEAIRRHWPGTADGLAAALRLAGETAPQKR